MLFVRMKLGICEEGIAARPWGVTVCHAAGSDRDYDRFCRAADLTSYLSSGRLLSDAGAATCKRIIAAIGAALEQQHQGILRKGHRLAFSVDERDQVFVNRVRIVVTSPEVRAHEFVAGVIRDYGHSISACSQAVWASLRSLCIKRKGKRGPDCIPGRAMHWTRSCFKDCRRSPSQAAVMAARSPSRECSRCAFQAFCRGCGISSAIGRTPRGAVSRTCSATWPRAKH